MLPGQFSWKFGTRCKTISMPHMWTWTSVICVYYSEGRGEDCHYRTLVSRVMHCLHVPSCGDWTETVYAAVLAGKGAGVGVGGSHSGCSQWNQLITGSVWIGLLNSQVISICIYTVYVPPNLVQANAQQCKMEPFLIECVVVWTTIVFHRAKICSERRR